MAKGERKINTINKQNCIEETTSISRNNHRRKEKSGTRNNKRIGKAMRIYAKNRTIIGKMM